MHTRFFFYALLKPVNDVVLLNEDTPVFLFYTTVLPFLYILKETENK